MNKAIPKILLFFFLTLTMTNIFAQNQNKSETQKITKKEDNKKIKLIEWISEKTCEKLNTRKEQKLTMEIIDEIITEISTKYHEKIRKKYEILTEDELELYINDLVKELNANCKVVREFINRPDFKLSNG